MSEIIEFPQQMTINNEANSSIDVLDRRDIFDSEDEEGQDSGVKSRYPSQLLG